MRKILIFAVCGFMAAGCVPSGLYHWGNYEQSLYDYTKQPGELEDYIASLDAIILAGEERGKVPPGIYAEYGHALMAAGREDEAKAYFAKERDLWPESAKLMQLLIDGPAENEDTESIEGAELGTTEEAQTAVDVVSDVEPGSSLESGDK